MTRRHLVVLGLIWCCTTTAAQAQSASRETIDKSKAATVFIELRAGAESGSGTGFVVDVRRREVSGLKEVAAVSGAVPVFDERLLQTLRWAAIHYVAPLAAVLAKAAPPNLPKRPPRIPGLVALGIGPSPLPGGPSTIPTGPPTTSSGPAACGNCTTAWWPPGMRSAH